MTTYGEGYAQALSDAIEIAKGHYQEYLCSCDSEERCGHQQASEWIRTGLADLRAGRKTLEEIVSPYHHKAKQGGAV